MTPRELATTPFPIPLMTPPVIKQNVNKKLHESLSDKMTKQIIRNFV